MSLGKFKLIFLGIGSRGSRPQTVSSQEIDFCQILLQLTSGHNVTVLLLRTRTRNPRQGSLFRLNALITLWFYWRSVRFAFSYDCRPRVERSINLPKDGPAESSLRRRRRRRRSLLDRSFVQRTLLKLFRLCIVSVIFHSEMNFPSKSIHWKREFSLSRQCQSWGFFFRSSIHAPGQSHSGGVIALCDFSAFYEFMSHFYENL